MTEVAISGKTKICGIIGDPVEHTMSPVMHNAAFKEKGLDYVYLAFRVRKEELGKAIAGMKALNIGGFNVTIPHKAAVIPLLDELDPLAERIGAVNTVVNNRGILKGYNTDAGGFMRSLLERGIQPDGLKAVVLGAGGASRAISFVLAQNGVRLTIVNRKSGLERAHKLAERVSRLFGREVGTLELSDDNLQTALKKADILVNATSVGMSPDIDGTPVPAPLLRKGLVIFDIVYNPLKTRLLKESEAAGSIAIGGLEMLVWQGALAFELWTGVKAPVELMKKVAGEALRKL